MCICNGSHSITAVQSKRLDFLRQLTQQLTLEELVAQREPGRVEYAVDTGSCVGTGLVYKSLVAVQDVFMSKGTVFPKHIHDETEYLIIYRGGIEVSGIKYEAASILCFRRGQEHTVKALEDTWMIGITIPASSAYPDVREYGAT